MRELSLIGKMKKILTTIMIFVLAVGVFAASKPVFAKSKPRITKVITLTKNEFGVQHKLSISSKEKVVAKVEFLSVKGKAEEDDLYFGSYEFTSYKNGKLIDGGKDSFFSPYSTPKLKKSSFKKGNILSLNLKKCFPMTGKSTVSWGLPKGITKIKMRVTYYTISGRSGINSFSSKKY